MKNKISVIFLASVVFIVGIAIFVGQTNKFLMPVMGICVGAIFLISGATKLPNRSRYLSRIFIIAGLVNCFVAVLDIILIFTHWKLNI